MERLRRPGNPPSHRGARLECNEFLRTSSPVRPPLLPFKCEDRRPHTTSNLANVARDRLPTGKARLLSAFKMTAPHLMGIHQVAAAKWGRTLPSSHRILRGVIKVPANFFGSLQIPRRGNEIAADVNQSHPFPRLPLQIPPFLPILRTSLGQDLACSGGVPKRTLAAGRF